MSSLFKRRASKNGRGETQNPALWSKLPTVSINTQRGRNEEPICPRWNVKAFTSPRSTASFHRIPDLFRIVLFVELGKKKKMEAWNFPDFLLMTRRSLLDESLAWEKSVFYLFYTWRGGDCTFQCCFNTFWLFQKLCGIFRSVYCQPLIFKLVKKRLELCLCLITSVVTVSLAVNLVSLESLSISPSNDVPFLMILHLRVDQHVWEVAEVPRKMWQFPFFKLLGDRLGRARAPDMTMLANRWQAHVVPPPPPHT